MYSEIDRKDALEKLIKICRSIENIDGVILVGSGAEGFTDKWSDIDLSIVICQEEKTRQVWDKINEKIICTFDIMKILYNEYGENNFLSAILLNNYLELDIGVLAINRLVAKRKSWNVLYDKSGIITKKLNDTWQERKIPDLNARVENSLNSIWYHIKNGVMALKRKKSYRVIKEIEELRNEIIEIRALQENKTAKHFRDVDDMEKCFLEKLEKTFFKEISIDELSKTLINSFNLYFDLIKEIRQNCEEVIKYENQLRKLLLELELFK
ncbi:putative nucleotidyltransferase [Anaerosolibacter carboniphilus]|uniref:Putative nucleotidyltransferase n=1 Tax=Anaerosolibacter carboniphilus TaxID=1417629 RepID=A0A841KX00_9FIRM|nr:nucleotidyltransferase domain-containing protein [Anaerosolibacter carboniphilus]MBB6217887.1 putative nucleotidyltransferase [Anaerosolibacter carboniphilus]